MSAAPERRLAKKRVAIYLALSFGVSWLVWISAGIALGTFEAGENSAPAIVGIIAATMFVPLLAALATNRIMGRVGRIDLALRPRLKGNVRIYAVSWLAPAVVALVCAALFFAVNPELLDTSLPSVAASTLAPGVDGVPSPSSEDIANLVPALCLFTVLIAPFINMIPAFGEEVGWRGMLFPSLCELVSPRAAAVVSGIMWGLWHAPIIAMGHNYGMGAPGFPVTNILVMTLACTAVGVLFAVLRVRSRSVWSCALAHGALNASANFGVLFCVAGQTLFGPSPLGLVAGIPVFVLAIWCLTRKYLFTA